MSGNNKKSKQDLTKIYTHFAVSDSEDQNEQQNKNTDNLIGQGQNIQKNAYQIDVQPSNYLYNDLDMPIEHVKDNQKMVEQQIIQELFSTNTHKQKTAPMNSYKLQISLQQSLLQIAKKIQENTNIENKINGLKMLSQKLRENRNTNNKKNLQILLNWIQSSKIRTTFIHEDSHPQILRNMTTILRHLYENDKIPIEWIINFVINGLKCSYQHEQYIKLLQSLLTYVHIQELSAVIQNILHEKELQNMNLYALLTTIIGNKYFSQENKKDKKNSAKIQNQRNNNNKLLQLQNMDSFELQQYLEQAQKQRERQKQKQQTDTKQSTIIQNLTLNLFKFLIQATDRHMNTYYPILNKLINYKHAILEDELSVTLSDLLKKGKVNSIWILEHCLRIDFGQVNCQRQRAGNGGNGGRVKGTKNKAKFNFITKLINEHLYEHLLIILAKARFNKVIVDKILNILILLSKNHKPLDQNYTNYIWKILGLHSKQQKQRQQFFNFVKDILRNQSNFTQEAVYFIFFQVLMGLSAQWFTLKILDCLEMLFMRLNEDLKLISYTDQTYSIQDPDLVGVQKFWYIYFHSNDTKVTKKCKDFLWKLATYNSSSQIKVKFLKQYVTNIIQYMDEVTHQFKNDFCNKGFDMIDKMMEETQKKQPQTSQQIQIIVLNSCREAMGAKKIHLRLSQKCSLSSMRQLISSSITPTNTNIRLICRGQILKGQKMTLKQLRIENKNTIMVVDLQQFTQKPVPMAKQKKNEESQKIISELIQIFGLQYDKQILRFIAEKMQGNSLQRISDTIMDPDKMSYMVAEYTQMNTKQKQDQKQKQNSANKVHFDGQQLFQHKNQDIFNYSNQNENENQAKKIQQKEKQQAELKQLNQVIKFSTILISNQNNIKQLLKLASQTNKKRGWQTIKNLPYPIAYLSQIKKKCEQKNWQILFPKQQLNQMICIYNAHLLKYILKLDKQKILIKKYLFMNKGFEYLSDWLRRLTNYVYENNIVIEQVTNILVIALEEQCEKLVQFRQRIITKKQKMLLGQLINQNLSEIELNQILHSEQHNDNNNSLQQKQKYGDQSYFNWLLELLLHIQNSNNNNLQLIQNIVEIMIYFLYESNERVVNILELSINQVFFICVNYGFVGEYVFLVAFGRVFSEGVFEERRLGYCRKFLMLSQFCFDFVDNSSQNKHNIGQQNPAPNILNSNNINIIYIYDLIACILDKITQHTETQIQITLKCLESIQNQAQKIQSEQLIGILDLLKLCIKLCNQNGSVQAKEVIQAMMGQFSKWLFNKFLFDLERPSRHIRNKIVRKVCYEVLRLIGEVSQENIKALINQIVKIQVKQRSKDQDYVQFRSQEYIGLTNLGATCYINSLLQQIYHTKFSKLLLEKGDKKPQHAQRMKYFKKIFMSLCYSIKNVVNPKQFIKNMKFYGQQINTSLQQDATQFLLSLFDHIEGEGCKEQVYDVFGGFLCNQITVETQEGVNDQILIKNNTEHFNNISLDIKGKKNLQEALAYLIKPQILDGQNKYYCEQFNKKMKASKRCYIESMPNILILTLKRFEYDIDSHSRHKLNDYFQFPSELDMHKYSAAYLRNKQENSQSKYKLSGILVHSGSAESGHYYSYIKIGEQWYEFNDKIVSEFNYQNNLKNQCFGCTQGKKTRNAYILFYEKIHTNYHGVYLNEIPQTNIYKRRINQQNAIFLKSRLIYDDNFKKFVQEIAEKSSDYEIVKFVDHVFGKKMKMEEVNQGKVYFDIDQEKVPLMNEAPDRDDIDYFDVI